VIDSPPRPRLVGVSSFSSSRAGSLVLLTLGLVLWRRRRWPRVGCLGPLSGCAWRWACMGAPCRTRAHKTPVNAGQAAHRPSTSRV